MLFNRNLAYDQALRNLDQEKWNNLNLRGRVQTLQSVENEMAARQGREPCKVEATRIGRAGEDQAAGAYDPGTKKIYVNSDLLYRDDNYKNDIKEHVDTVLHEGRHAYQDQAVNAEIEHPNREEVYRWAENNHNYINDQENIRAYYNQPVEKDAYAYSEEMTSQVMMERDGVARQAQARPQGKDAFAQEVNRSDSRGSDAGAGKEAFSRQAAQEGNRASDTAASRAAFSSQAAEQGNRSNSAGPGSEASRAEAGRQGGSSYNDAPARANNASRSFEGGGNGASSPKSSEAYASQANEHGGRSSSAAAGKAANSSQVSSSNSQPNSAAAKAGPANDKSKDRER